MITPPRANRPRPRRFGTFCFLSRPAHVWTAALARPATSFRRSEASH